MAIAIRPATPADASAVADVHRTARAATMPYLPPQRRTRAEVVAWADALIAGPGTVLVAECTTEPPAVLGYAALDGAVLDHLYLRPDAVRRGIGTLLLDEAFRHSPRGLTLHVFEANTAARAFYARHGFVEIGRDSDNMERLPSVTLRRTR